MNELPPLEPDVLALIDASIIEPAPAVARVRLRGRLEAAIAGAGGSAGGSAGAGTGAPSAAPAVAASSGFRVSGLSARAVAPLVVSFVLGAITSGAALMALGVARPSLPVASATRAPKVHLAAEQPAAPAPSEAQASPSPNAPSPAASERTAARASPRAEPALRSQLALERHLLDSARAALERGEPAVALSVAARHERQFPSGALSQEREAMAIRALVAMGRTSEARARAARFRASYPDSVLLSTIDEMLDTPAPQ